MPAPNNRTCTVEGCQKKHSARGMCRDHYTRFIRSGGVSANPIVRQSGCVESGCGSIHFAKGRCFQHYSKHRYQQKKIGAIESRRCGFMNCELPGQSKGYCPKHYSMELRRGKLGALPCSIENCKRFASRGDKCENHFSKIRLYGLTVEQMNSFERGVACEICGERARCADHHHGTGKFRGFLCHLCNKGIGLLRDRPDLLRAAAAYLERTSCAP